MTLGHICPKSYQNLQIRPPIPRGPASGIRLRTLHACARTGRSLFCIRTISYTPRTSGSVVQTIEIARSGGARVFAARGKRLCFRPL